MTETVSKFAYHSGYLLGLIVEKSSRARLIEFGIPENALIEMERSLMKVPSYLHTEEKEN